MPSAPSPYRVVRDALSLTHESGTSQNFHWFYLLLTSLADLDEANPAPVVDSDPFAEVLRRLSVYSGFAAQEVRKLLYPRVK